MFTIKKWLILAIYKVFGHFPFLKLIFAIHLIMFTNFFPKDVENIPKPIGFS